MARSRCENSKRGCIADNLTEIPGERLGPRPLAALPITLIAFTYAS